MGLELECEGVQGADVVHLHGCGRLETSSCSYVYLLCQSPGANMGKKREEEEGACELAARGEKGLSLVMMRTLSVRETRSPK